MKDGGPAFPCDLQFSGSGYCANSDAKLTGGMSLRDWFAGQALIGYLAIHSDAECSIPEPQSAARSAYTFADSMLAEREKRLAEGGKSG